MTQLENARLRTTIIWSNWSITLFLTKAPEFNKTGIVGFPMYIDAILVWPIETIGGYAAFLKCQSIITSKTIFNKWAGSILDSQNLTSFKWTLKCCQECHAKDANAKNEMWFKQEFVIYIERLSIYIMNSWFKQAALGIYFIWRFLYWKIWPGVCSITKPIMR